MRFLLKHAAPLSHRASLPRIPPTRHSKSEMPENADDRCGTPSMYKHSKPRRLLVVGATGWGIWKGLDATSLPSCQ